MWIPAAAAAARAKGLALRRVEVEPLEARVRRLERANRALRRGLGLLGLAAAGLLLMAPTRAARTPAVLEAERFVLRDAGGNERARLSAVDGGASALALFDASGHSRLMLAAAPDGTTSVLLRGKHEHVQIALRLKASGSASLGMVDSEMRRRVVLEMGADGAGSLRLLDAEGRVRSELGLGPDGEPKPVRPEPVAREAAGAAPAGEEP